jgi:eukaryotic-like serine/threonine-protein kinase
MSHEDAPEEAGGGVAAAPFDDTVRGEDAARELARKLGGAPPVHAWGRYELLELLGRGGMGAVYKARDKRIDRMAAVKFIHSDDPYTTKRFLQEARAQSRIDHPSVCKVLEVGEVEGKVYIAMQLIAGKPLSQAMDAMSLTEKVQVVRTMAEAAHAAHRLGIIHRDIKPANIMVEEMKGASGERALRPVLMDFGLAREGGDRQGLTESGAVMGTPSYMPPEQARGDARHVDCRSDVYGLGATLYHLLSGEPPFVQGETGNVLLQVLTEDPVPLRVKAPSIPEGLDVIVGKCLNKEPHQRYPTAADLAADLERYLNQERVVARRLGLGSRLYWRGKRNKPMAVAVLALLCSLLAFAGYGLRTTIVNARNEALAKKRAELGQRLAQSVKDLEWLMRSAYLVPLHDVSPEKAIVRARMAQIEAEMRSFGDISAGLDHYALGRGHLALEEWEEARAELTKAESLGVREPELDYALGRVLGELYRRALEDARKSGDKGYFEKRKRELDEEHLRPALAHLERCRGLPTLSAGYLDGLIDFYNQRYDEALHEAEIAGESIPWLYEAPKLEGDVLVARALEARDHGNDELAARHFEQAVLRYEKAADIGRSDHQVYEALAEAWIRQEEMDIYSGRDPAPRMEKALAAADEALRAAPAESNGHTKKAFAYSFQTRYAEGHGAPSEAIERLRRAQIEAGEQAIALHPNDAYARDITGIAYTGLADYLLELGKPAEVRALLEHAFAHLEQAIRYNPRFPWAHNDYGYALAIAGDSRQKQNEDPQEWFNKAIEATRKATEIDDQYSFAYNNMSVYLIAIADWKAEHGEDPEKAVAEAVQAADRAIEITHQTVPYGNSGWALTIAASYRLDAGKDGREPARLAIDRLKTVLTIDPKFVAYERWLGRAYYLLAGHERAQGLDPKPSLDAGLAALEPCYRVEPDNAECKAEEAELRAERPETLDRALDLAREAVQKLPDRGDLWLVVGQICLRRAEALPAGPKRGPVLEEGLHAIEKALAKAPGSPRALAIGGALSLRKAQAAADPAESKASLESARESLSKAFVGNPLLKRRYGAAAAEADRLRGRP